MAKNRGLPAWHNPGARIRCHGYHDARIPGIGGGTNEIMNEIIAKHLGL